MAATEGLAVQAVLDALPLPVLVIEPSGEILLANKLARERLSEPDLAGPLALLLKDPDRPVPAAGAGGDQFSLTASRLDRAAGRLLITARTAAEHQRDEDAAQRQRGERLERIGLLAAGIAHDFNNLLTGILGNATLIQNQFPQIARPDLKAIIKASQKGADLTAQLLAYAGKTSRLAEKVDLSDLVRHARVLLRLSISKNIDVRWRLAENLPAVAGDPSQIEQILMNLLTNASEAIGEGSNGTITVSTRHVEAGSGSYVCLEVADTGCGISEAARARIFEPFYSTKASGRGLGLAAVMGIVRAHGGFIEADSTPDQGTVFRVMLPASAQRGDWARAKPDEESAAPQGSGVILVVDDEPLVRAFVRAALEAYGYQVRDAANGRDAMSALAANPDVNLVLLDVLMPVMGGGEALQAIRRIAPSMPVIVMSGYNEKEALRLCAASQRTAFIQKPYTAAQLALKVHGVMIASSTSPLRAVAAG